MSVRNYENKIRVYVDLDGVIADFEGAANAHGMKMSEFKLQPGTYLNLPLFDGAIDFIKTLESNGFDVFFLSKIPTKNVLSASEKYAWVMQHFGIKYVDRLILTADKGCVGTERDFLIDDHPEWANAHNFVGTIIKFQDTTYDKVIDLIGGDNSE